MSKLRASTTYLVRHAKAGSRRQRRGDDRHRPLSPAGRRQADELAERLVDAGVTGLWSSPYERCVETLVPLGKRTRHSVVRNDRLAEGAPVESTLELLAEGGAGAVLCSHGDLIPEVISALVRRGMTLGSPADWRKASLWILEHDGDRFNSGAAEPPPA